jgi:serine/threonine protein kinase
MDIEQLGEELNLPPYKGRIQSRYCKPDFLESISDCQGLLDGPSSRILLVGRNRVGSCRLKIAAGEIQDVVIKEFRILGINKLKSLVLPSKACKAWKGSSVLVQKGISTPAPVAYLETRKGLFLDRSFFVTELIGDVEEIRSLFFSVRDKELESLLTELAGYLSQCREKGVIHRDLSDGNILVKKTEEGRCGFYLADTNRIRYRRHVGMLSAVRNVIRLGVPPSHQRFFLQEYLQPQRLNYLLWFWYKLNKHTFSGYTGFKRRLRLKRIAQKLKIQ